MSDGFLGADETGSKLTARSTHFEVRNDSFTTPDSAGHKDRNIVDMGKDFLGQNTGGNRADMAPGLHAFDDQGIGA